MSLSEHHGHFLAGSLTGGVGSYGPEPGQDRFFSPVAESFSTHFAWTDPGIIWCAQQTRRLRDARPSFRIGAFQRDLATFMRYCLFRKSDEQRMGVDGKRLARPVKSPDCAGKSQSAETVLLQTGFTLTEMLITVAIIVLMLAAGVPAYQSLATSMRMSGEVNSFLADMKFARSEAIKRGQPVYVCSTANGSTCSNDTSTSSSNWATGWLVYVDNTGSGFTSAPSAGQVLRVSPGVTRGDTLSGASAAQISQSGYNFLVGTVTLHDANNDAAQRRCITFAAGSSVLSKGSGCP